MTSRLEVAAILLAAGASRRMGSNKLLLEFEGEPLVRRAARRALAAGLNPVVAVLGHEADRVRAALDGLACQYTVNPALGSPMGRSLSVGVQALPLTAPASLVMLADMPLVTERMLRTLAERAAVTNAAIITSCYGGTFAPPVLFRRVLFAELATVCGEVGGSELIWRHRHDALIVDWPAEALADIDTPEDFATSNAHLLAQLIS